MLSRVYIAAVVAQPHIEAIPREEECRRPIVLVVDPSVSRGSDTVLQEYRRLSVIAGSDSKHRQ